jgi:hypothetical protein
MSDVDAPTNARAAVLGHEHYRAGAGSLWRWVDEPHDVRVARFVAGLDAPAVAATRDTLTADECYTLLLFAKRRAFAALRTGDAALAGEAFTALSALAAEPMSLDDVSSTAALVAYAARCVGGEPAELAADAIVTAAPEVSGILVRVTGADVETVRGWAGHRQVTGPDGVVLVGEHGEPYAPERDLADAALRVAGGLEAAGGYRVGEITVAAAVPSFWLTGRGEEPLREALRGVTGAALVHAHPESAGDTDPAPQFLLVCLAETASAADAGLIAAAANGGGPDGAALFGLAVDRLCVLMVSATVGQHRPPAEDDASLARFAPMLRDAVG